VKKQIKGRDLEGIIQGCKEGSEPLYMVWIGDKYGWVRESLIIKKSNQVQSRIKNPNTQSEASTVNLAREPKEYQSRYFRISS